MIQRESYDALIVTGNKSRDFSIHPIVYVSPTHFCGSIAMKSRIPSIVKMNRKSGPSEVCAELKGTSTVRFGVLLVHSFHKLVRTLSRDFAAASTSSMVLYNGAGENLITSGFRPVQIIPHSFKPTTTFSITPVPCGKNRSDSWAPRDSESGGVIIVKPGSFFIDAFSGDTKNFDRRKKLSR